MSKVQINRRLVYLFAFLFVAIPVLVGVLVWHFTNEANSSDSPSSSQTGSAAGDAAGGGGSTDPPGASTTPRAPTPEEIAARPWLSLRLPDFQVPLHYDISLYPNFYDDNGEFDGNETIDIRIPNATKFLLVHVLDLTIHEVGVTYLDGGDAVEVARHFEAKENQFLVVETREEVAAGSKVQLSLRFSGSLTNSIVGFYKSQYVNSKTGQTRYLATTKFEPVNARRAFPCMDEPSLKAEYTITLFHRHEYIALSNMPPDGEPYPAEGNLLRTRFQRSKTMSTYLVCFIVCDFAYAEDHTASGTTVRVYATPDKKDQVQFALQVAVHTMREYEHLFNISYPLPKQDLIAIPDFVSGAMENWGLITFREVNLLYDPNKTSDASKQRVAVVVAHEISHQWFGNLVTMAWWNDLWLNEGFASFMQYIGTDSMIPKWEMMSQFLISATQPVMATDAGVSSHPIVVPVNSPSEINEVFDVISYNKGSSVIRMMEGIMGKDKFFQGVSLYLQRHMWGNAETDDLWQALSEVEGAPDVKHIMDTWTLQMGFPYINLTFAPNPRSTPTTTVTAVQDRFLADPAAVFDENESPFNYKWYVSLDCLSSSGTKTTQVLDLTDATFDIDINTNSPQPGWVKCNLDQTGFYRVNYPASNWRQLAEMLRSTPEETWQLSEADRSGLLDDAMNLARTGLLGYDVALEMTSYLHKETSFIPWQSTFESLTYITSMLNFDPDYKLWRDFVLSIVTPALERLGWEDQGTHLVKRLRGMLIDLACKHGDPGCLHNVTSKFRDWLDRGVKPPVNTKNLVYKWGMWAGGSAEDWDRLWQMYLTEVVPQEKISLLRALAMTKSPWLLARLLAYTKEGVHIRRQDFIVVVQLVAINPAARSQLWNWVQQNWPDFVDRFTLFDRYFGRLVPYTTDAFNTEFDKEQVLAFFEQYPEAGSGARGRQQALERITENIHWMTNFKPTVAQWLRDRTGQSSTQTP